MEWLDGKGERLVDWYIAQRLVISLMEFPAYRKEAVFLRYRLTVTEDRATRRSDRVRYRVNTSFHIGPMYFAFFVMVEMFSDKYIEIGVRGRPGSLKMALFNRSY